MEKGKVTIVVVGDQGTGKTSLITSLVSDSFQEKVPPKVPPVFINPDTTPERVEVNIIDTSSKPSDVKQLEADMLRADAICIVYAINNTASKENIRDKWLDKIKNHLKLEVPIIIVGNKNDLREGQRTLEELKEDMEPYMKDYPQVESCIECSAKTLFNVDEVFYFAQKAVLYPSNVLYDAVNRQFKPAAVGAMKRIFKLCDLDCDNHWNDAELNYFQGKCFEEGPLDTTAIAELKRVVREHGSEDAVDDEKGLSVTGFLTMQHLLIQKGRLETIWAVLRQFGYDDTIKLRKEYVDPGIEITESLREERVEISTEGKNFLAGMFARADLDKDGTLNKEELQNVFSTTPDGKPVWDDFGKKVEYPSPPVSKNGTGIEAVFEGITLESWLALWQMTSVINYHKAYAYLSYLGYEPGQNQKRTDIIQVTKLKDKKRPRTTFLCFLFGAEKSGKTSIIRGLVGKPFTTETPQGTLFGVNALEKDKILAIGEFSKSDEKLLLSTEEKIKICDVACMVYDSTNQSSFQHVQRIADQLHEKFPDTPIVFVASKTDLVRNSIVESSARSYCKTFGIPPPIEISAKNNEFNNLYKFILDTINDYKPQRKSGSTGWLVKGIIGVGTIVAIGALGYFSKDWIQQHLPSQLEFSKKK